MVELVLSGEVSESALINDLFLEEFLDYLSLIDLLMVEVFVLFRGFVWLDGFRTLHRGGFPRITFNRGWGSFKVDISWEIIAVYVHVELSFREEHADSLVKHFDFLILSGYLFLQICHIE